MATQVALISKIFLLETAVYVLIACLDGSSSERKIFFFSYLEKKRKKLSDTSVNILHACRLYKLLF